MDELLIALDVDTVEEARRLSDTLRGLAGGFKVGNQLFTRAGRGIVRELVERDERVFLDLKFHDIPNTVGAHYIVVGRPIVAAPDPRRAAELSTAFRELR